MARMSKTYKYAAHGWVDVRDLAPAVLIGRYRTRTIARIAAWWFRVGRQDAHSWVNPEHVISIVENGRAV